MTTRMETFRGETRSVSEWARVLQIPVGTISRRMHHGMSFAEAVTTPRRAYKPSEMHGLTGAPEYGHWRAMIRRCHERTHSDWAKWGGRGITVCDRWRASFLCFLEDMGPRPSAKHSVDRIDNGRGYEPGNCRWATAFEQAGNRRNARLVTIGNKTMCVRAWCRELGVNPHTVKTRIQRGIDPLVAFGLQRGSHGAGA